MGNEMKLINVREIARIVENKKKQTCQSIERFHWNFKVKHTSVINYPTEAPFGQSFVLEGISKGY